MVDDFLKQNEYSIPEQPGSGFQVVEPKKSGKKKIIIAVIAAFLIIFLGFAIALATKLWDPLWNPFYPNPNKVLEQAIANMADLDSLHSEMILKLDFGELAGLSALKITAKMDSDDRDKGNPKSQIDTDLNFSVIDTPVDVLFGMQMRTIGDVFYFNLDTIPFILTTYASMFGIDVSQFQNVWYRFDPQELGFSVGDLEISESDELALQKDLEDLYDQYPIFEALDRLPEEKIDGVKTYHYLVALKEDNFKQFMVQLPAILEKYEFWGVESLSEEEKQEAINSLDEFFEKGNPEFEIWIGKKDKMIYRVAWESSYEYESALASNPLVSSDAKIKSGMAQLRTQAELVYVNDRSYSNFCSQGKLNVQEDYIPELREYILESGGSDVTCYASGDQYCLSVKLVSKNGYYCVDSLGEAFEIGGGQEPCGSQRYCIESGIEATEKHETAKQTMDIALDLEFSNFNEPVDIRAPENSKSLIELLMDLMMNSSSYYSPEQPYYPEQQYDYPQFENPLN